MRLILCDWVLIVVLSVPVGAQMPNILFIVSEDNGPELSCYGDANAVANGTSPTLDQLAREGVLFQNAFVPYSVCSPSRACFYTGTHVAQNGHEGLQTHKFAMYEAYPTYYRLLKEAGYRTGLIGKLHINPGNAVSNWVDYRAITGSNFGQSSRNMRTYGDAAHAFIDGTYAGANTAEPFVLTINYPDAHLPMHDLAPTNNVADADTLPKAPLDWEDVQTIPWVGASSGRLRGQTAGYYNCLRRMDDGIAMVLAHLAAAGPGVADNTLVIYMGDHGAQFSRGKTSCYDAGLRVPLIVKWPGNTADLPGEFNVCENLVSSIDVMPTILKAAGVAVPSACSGAALQPLLEGQDVPWRSYVFGHATGSAPSLNYIQLSARDDRYKLIWNPFRDPSMPAALQNLQNRCAIAYLGGASHFAAGTSQAEIDDVSTSQLVKDAYVRYLHPPLYELYDLDLDPEEWTNLADDPAHAAVKARMIAALDAWQADPIIADPWSDLGNIQAFGEMQEDAIGTNYNSNGAFIWDYLEAAIPWNYPGWKRVNFPQFVPPMPTVLYGTGFEQGEGFTFPTTGNFVEFPATPVTDSGGGVWTGGSESGVWNRSDIPPEGVQALRVGTDASGTSWADVELPAALVEIGNVNFSYANYSNSTSCTGRVCIRPQSGGAWEVLWEKTFSGLQVDWKIKPWPISSVTVNRSDGPFELRFETVGTRGVKFDQLEVTELVPNVSQDYAAWRAVEFLPPEVGDDLISGPNADPDADRISNWLEFLLGKKPLVAESWYEAFGLTGEYTTLDYTLNSRAAGGLAGLEMSRNLVDWVQLGRSRLIGQDLNGVNSMRVEVPPMGGDRFFFRMQSPTP